jgi:hypothetical protein
MPQTVGCTGSAFAVKAKILFVEDSLKKLTLPLGKNEIGGSGRAPLFPKDIGVHGSFCGRVRAINARRAKPASKSLKRPHSTGHTLAVSDAALSADFNLRMVLPKSSSSTIVTSLNSRRHASSGRNPVLTANSTKSCSCSASQLKPFFFGSCARFRVAS